MPLQLQAILFFAYDRFEEIQNFLELGPMAKSPPRGLRRLGTSHIFIIAMHPYQGGLVLFESMTFQENVKESSKLYDENWAAAVAVLPVRQKFQTQGQLNF